ncbi:hypothetical protein METBIDRAFT_31362 [Metschnikowia bicuspidata var. bicuspidata NRRL YB-4993]|uniref:PDZ GRASP-type domain-containing protein n=1 Tax=Metschnikowia bicuspidata var. bicuspidata NRRL YB-4993 TaxID=869754 RepID=A0A1A0HED0_9ASCO|nr:hypothetical protein METBIDRAFT_31362 [Metschnikowia bicuspidata var. bicuspidata NRRL YB-4993]OBA22469.1 hypothetical protein METBIDRAFT_31362 [Metschnikowia bicuspidata var. bicuspidata NRRL YB-4993]
MFSFARKLKDRLDGGRHEQDPYFHHNLAINNGGYGLRILHVAPDSPAHVLQLESWFDYIVGLDGHALPMKHPLPQASYSVGDDGLLHYGAASGAASAHAGAVDVDRVAQHFALAARGPARTVSLQIWSAKGGAMRHVSFPLPPPAGAADLPGAFAVPGSAFVGLGVTLAPQHVSTATHVWRILSTHALSPAFQAQLVPYSDYIIGCDSAFSSDQAGKGLLAGGGEQLLGSALLAYYTRHHATLQEDRIPVVLYVYNHDFDVVRPVTVHLSCAWAPGANCGVLGCDVGYGLLHRLPEVPGKYGHLAGQDVCVVPRNAPSQPSGHPGTHTAGPALTDPALQDPAPGTVSFAGPQTGHAKLPVKGKPSDRYAPPLDRYAPPPKAESALLPDATGATPERTSHASEHDRQGLHTQGQLEPEGPQASMLVGGSVSGTPIGSALGNLGHTLPEPAAGKDIEGEHETEDKVAAAGVADAGVTNADVTNADVTDAGVTNADVTEAEVSGAEVTGAGVTHSLKETECGNEIEIDTPELLHPDAQKPNANEPGAANTEAYGPQLDEFKLGLENKDNMHIQTSAASHAPTENENKEETGLVASVQTANESSNSQERSSPDSSVKCPPAGIQHPQAESQKGDPASFVSDNEFLCTPASVGETQDSGRIGHGHIATGGNAALTNEPTLDENIKVELTQIISGLISETDPNGNMQRSAEEAPEFPSSSGPETSVKTRVINNIDSLLDEDVDFLDQPEDISHMNAVSAQGLPDTCAQPPLSPTAKHQEPESSEAVHQRQTLINAEITEPENPKVDSLMCEIPLTDYRPENPLAANGTDSPLSPKFSAPPLQATTMFLPMSSKFPLSPVGAPQVAKPGRRKKAHGSGNIGSLAEFMNEELSKSKANDKNYDTKTDDVNGVPPPPPKSVKR